MPKRNTLTITDSYGDIVEFDLSGHGVEMFLSTVENSFLFEKKDVGVLEEVIRKLKEED